MTKKRLTCIDIFCGCGGFSLGFLQAGFEVVAALDNSLMATATYYTNLCDEATKIIGDIPKEKLKFFGKPTGYRHHLGDRIQIPPVRALFIKDILSVSGWDLMAAAGVEEVDVVMGSPPCQTFSKCNMNKKKGDLRDFLLFEFGRLILEIHPRQFIMENVPEIANAKLPDGRNTVDTFGEMVQKYDWDLYYEIQEMYPSDAWSVQPGHQTSLI